MTTLRQDNAIRKTLTDLNPLLEKIKDLAALSMMETTTLIHDWNILYLKLKDQLLAYPENKFSYEFYRESSDIIEKITHLRLETSLRLSLKSTGLVDKFNDLALLIRAAVYKHPALKTTPISTTITQDSLEMVQMQAKAAAQRATDAAAEAEQANEMGLKYIEQIQKSQQEGKQISQKLLDKSLEHTLTIYAKNAASVLALDEAAIALTQLDEAIKN